MKLQGGVLTNEAIGSFWIASYKEPSWSVDGAAEYHKS